MNDDDKTAFKVQKTAYYNEKGLFIEEYHIFMNGRDSIMCPREDLERLYKIMGIALSDRMENSHE